MTETDPSTENPDKPGRDETGKEQEIKDVPKDDRVELKPLSMSSLQEAVQDDFNLVKETSEAHSILASWWDVVAKWTRLVVAFTAALSAVSLVADNAISTTTFTVLTALIAALNAAFNPPETSAKHRLSAKEYHLISRRFELLWRKVNEYGWGDEVKLDDHDLKVFYEHYLSHRSEIEQATERAPAINQLQRRHKHKKKYSWWNYWCFKREVKRDLKYRQVDLAMQLERKKAEKSYQSKLEKLQLPQDEF